MEGLNTQEHIQACQPRGAMENAENYKKKHVNMHSNTKKT